MTYFVWCWQIDLVTETELGSLTERIKVWVFCCQFSYICEEEKNNIILDGSAKFPNRRLLTFFEIFQSFFVEADKSKEYTC